MGVLRVGQMDVAEKLLSNYYPIDGCFESWANGYCGEIVEQLLYNRWEFGKLGRLGVG